MNTRGWQVRVSPNPLCGSICKVDKFCNYIKTYYGFIMLYVRNPRKKFEHVCYQVLVVYSVERVSQSVNIPLHSRSSYTR